MIPAIDWHIILPVAAYVGIPMAVLFTIAVLADSWGERS